MRLIARFSRMACSVYQVFSVWLYLVYFIQCMAYLDSGFRVWFFWFRGLVYMGEDTLEI